MYTIGGIAFWVQDFARISRINDERFHLLFREERNDSVLQWFCTDASDFLAERHDACHSTVAFSATLSPIAHFTSLLGLDGGERGAADTALIPYPFPRENLSVMIDPALDTRYRSRMAQLPLLTGRIREIAAEAPGTWLLFFSQNQSAESCSMIAAAAGTSKPRM